MELKPCPFCGGEAVIEEVRRDVGHDVIRWSAGCKADEGSVEGQPCVGYMSVMTYARRIDAANAWNRRAPTVNERQP